MPGPALKKVAKLLGKEVKRAGLTVSATLIKVTAGTRTAGSSAGGTNPTETSYSARGWDSAGTLDQFPSTLIEVNDRVVYLLGTSIAGGQVPTVKDRVTIEGVTSRIIHVNFDPAKALYVLLTRS